MNKRKVDSKLDIVAMINKNLEKLANPAWKFKENTMQPRIKPSDLASKCFRKIFYSYLRTPVDTKTKIANKRQMDAGEAFGDLIMNWMKDLPGENILIPYRSKKTGEILLSKWTGRPDPEFPIVCPELDIRSGKIDGVGILDDKLVLYEFKSTGVNKFREILKSKKPKPGHAIQAGTYLHLFEHCLNQGDYAHIEELNGFTEVHAVIIIYISRDTVDFCQFILKPEDIELETIVAKIAKVKDYVAKRELPPPVEDFCRTCGWQRKCEVNKNPLDKIEK